MMSICGSEAISVQHMQPLGLRRTTDEATAIVDRVGDTEVWRDVFVQFILQRHR